MSLSKYLKYLICCAGLATIPVMAQMPEVGDTVVDFTLKDLNDQSHTLSDYLGKAILLFLLTPS